MIGICFSFVLLLPIANRTIVLHKKVRQTGEKSVRIILQPKFGKLRIAAGKKHIIVDASLRYDPTTFDHRFDYKENKLYVTTILKTDKWKKRVIAGNKEKIIVYETPRDLDLERNSWKLKFIPDVPLSFDCMLNACESSLDLAGLAIKGLDLYGNTGKISLNFGVPNKTFLRHFRVRVGSADFEGKNLGNARFHRFFFDGGNGDVILDFGGVWDQKRYARIDLASGNLEIKVPKEVGIKIAFFGGPSSHVHLEGFKKLSKNCYINGSYSEGKELLNIKIITSTADVNVKEII